MNRSPLRAFLLIPLVLACFGLSPQARAECRNGCDEQFNTFLGTDALLNNTNGDTNVAIGYNALNLNTSGSSNTAVGMVALKHNTDGRGNVAIGAEALEWNTTGDINTATGFFALWQNTTGSENTATGDGALAYNTTGNDNTANGVEALEHNDTGSENTAMGVHALEGNNSGNANTACGFDALGSTSGSNNIGLGHGAGSSLTTGSNNIDIGNAGVAGESKTIRIGTRAAQRNTFIAGISGVTVANGVGVIIDNTGHLGTVVSSGRFKDAIKPMDKASEAVLALKPVTFHYKQELDPEGVPQFGLVAEEVEKVNPDLVARDADGKAYTVRYEAVNAMLLNEFLKEHRKVEEQQATIAQLKAVDAKQEEKISALTELVKEQAAQIQKVSAQIEASIRAQQTVVSNP
jgi:trimeric autotransporter adhesin